jgi:hypothetical protein
MVMTKKDLNRAFKYKADPFGQTDASRPSSILGIKPLVLYMYSGVKKVRG